MAAYSRESLRGLGLRAEAMVIGSVFETMARLGRYDPRSRPERHGVEVTKDVPYRSPGGREHQLDIYRPAASEGPLPVVLYVHGGGFALCSKETHWIMGLSFARRGFLVFSINYRLAPRHRYPAAIEDACHAWQWVARHAHRFGGDPARVVLAGESAGANLVTSLAIASSYRRDEPWAREVFDAELRPRAVLPACGIFQVTDAGRFARRRAMSSVIAGRIRAVSRVYLGDRHDDVGHPELDLADPLVFLERNAAPDRPLPRFYIPVGTKDPLLDDTRRLSKALADLKVEHEVSIFPGELHAFHALHWRPAARRCWQEMHAFIHGSFADLAAKAEKAA